MRRGSKGVRADEENHGRRRWLLRPGTFIVAVLACWVCSAGAASPAGAVAAPNAPGRAQATAGLASRAEPAIEPQVCSGCEPPLIYEGGPVMSTNAAPGLTVTPIFWEPSGGKYVFPSKYEDIIDGYIKNVAAASGSTDNVFSIPTEYYQVAGGVKTSITYAIHAGPDLVDTDAFPAETCTPDPGYNYCITDSQLRTELSHVTASQKWATTLANFYPVFFPPGVETKDNHDGSNSASGFCGYHRAFGQGADQTVYANMPYEQTGCDAGQAPNGDLPGRRRRQHPQPRADRGHDRPARPAVRLERQGRQRDRRHVRSDLWSRPWLDRPL